VTARLAARVRPRLAVAAALVGVPHLVVAMAPWLAPYDHRAQDRSLPYAPPTRIRFVDADGRFHLRPFVHPWVERTDSPGTYHEDRSRVYPLRLLAEDEGAGLAEGGVRRLVGVAPPARLFLLGSDGYGRDQLSRLLHGGRISLLAGLLAAAISHGLGLAIGTAAGFYGGKVDAALMRAVELFLSLPWLYLLFAVRAFLPLDMDPRHAFLAVVLVIGLVDWARPARLVRGVVLSAKERDYVLAARGFGASDRHLLARHVLPEAGGVVLTQAALAVPVYVLAEVTLSFLGLGVGEPVPSLGNMLGALQEYHVLASYWWMLLPGMALVPVFLGYQLLGEALRERQTGYASMGGGAR
jgi:peptide/nickel transport system permease protein